MPLTPLTPRPPPTPEQMRAIEDWANVPVHRTCHAAGGRFVPAELLTAMREDLQRAEAVLRARYDQALQALGQRAGASAELAALSDAIALVQPQVWLLTREIERDPEAHGGA